MAEELAQKQEIKGKSEEEVRLYREQLQKRIQEKTVKAQLAKKTEEDALNLKKEKIQSVNHPFLSLYTTCYVYLYHSIHMYVSILPPSLSPSLMLWCDCLTLYAYVWWSF